MKIMSLLIFAACMQVSATGLSQQVTLSVKDAPLQTVFTTIEQQTGYVFFFNEKSLTGASKVTLQLKNAPLQKALEACFERQALTYTIVGKNIVVQRQRPAGTAATPSTFFTPPPVAHDIHVHITDSTGNPLQGASVIVKGTKQGGQTDAHGNITLAGLNGGETLVVSYVGYETKEVRVGDNTALSIALKHIASQLEDMVLKGYYATTKALNTGSVSTVTAAEIATQPVGDPLAALQGRVPGLYIQQNSGAPGRAFTVLLRGRNSIANGNDPLYIVDGVPFNATPLNSISLISPGAGRPTSPFNDLNPADIESIQVLKDADATAIYGSRGANGVILINTRKGQVGKSRFDLNLYSGGGKVTRKLDLMNTEEYLAMRREAFQNDNVTPGPSDYDLNGTFDQDRYTDWQKVLIGGTAKVTDVQAALSGGNNTTQYRIGGGYRYDGTVYPGDENSQKGSVLFSLQHRSEDQKFNISFTGNYVLTQNKLPIQDLTEFILLAPNSPAIYNPDGTLNWQNSSWSNPFTNILQTNTENTNNLISNLLLSYEIIKGLQLKLSAGYNKEEMTQSMLTPFSAYDPVLIDVAPLLRSNLQSTTDNTSWLMEPQVDFSTRLWKGTLDALVGTSFQETKLTSLEDYAYGFTDDALIKNMAAGSLTGINENRVSQYRYNALYGRIGYNLLDKYVLNFTGRRDGSSRFGPGRQFGNFGSVGAAWIFSKERFMHNGQGVLSFGKIRGSIGSTGNDRLTGYQYLSTYSAYSYSYQGVSGLYPTQLTNPYFGWERVNKIEMAVDLGFWNNRLMISASAYRNRTGNQLVGYALPVVTGFSSIQANLPAVVENKGLEIELNTVNVEQKDFTWNTAFNISFPRNKLISYPNLASSSYSTRYFIGKPLFIQNLYVYTGIDPQTGLYTFKDKDGDGSITAAKDRSPVFVGQYFFGGLSNHLKYKSWTLDFMFSFCRQQGLQYTVNGIQPGWYNGGAGNQLRSIANSNNRQPYTQDFSNASATQYILFTGSNGFIGDASYIRLKNIALSWAFTDKLKPLHCIKSGRLFLQCQNLFTITGYKGLDPEPQIGIALSLPPLRMITAGIQVGL